MQLDTAQLNLTSGGPGPPLQKTTVLHQIHTADGQHVQPEINARIDKGFFLADQDWTCYRRNYFSVACSYSLTPRTGSTPLYLLRPSGASMTESIQGFAMTIAAVVDGAGGKPVELVQHTPKRDKGPQGKPERVKLNPHSAGSVGLYSGSGSLGGSLGAAQGFEQPYSQGTAEQRTVANFERIQFKSATANNGKRRAAQQYYHLIVELFADVAGSWVKVATRISVPMVVRGRSPGHYQDNRRGSSSSTGPGGAGGSDGGAGHPSLSLGPSSGGRGLSDAMSLMGGSSSILGGGGYQAASGASSLHQSPSSLSSHPVSSGSSNAEHVNDGCVDAAMSSQAGSTVDEAPSFQFYPSPFLDPHAPHLRPPPAMPAFGAPLLASADGHLGKAYGFDDARRGSRDLSGPSLPPPVVSWPGSTIGAKETPRPNLLRTSCGRFVGSDTSRGFYPDLPAL